MAGSRPVPGIERVLQEHGPALFRIAQAYAATRADADDLYQEMCLALWRALPSFRGEASVKTFVWRVAHNRGLTFRARSRRPFVELGAAAEVADPGATPEESLHRQLSREELLDAIRRLSDAQCQVALLALEGLSHAEMAEVLGISVNAVAVRLNRARQSLQTLLTRSGS